MPTIEFKGIHELERKLKKGIGKQEVKEVVRKNGSQLQDQAQKNADFRGHYGYVEGKEGIQFIKPTGTLKRSIGLDIKDGGLTAEVEPTAEYAPYVELGTRFMEAQPYLKPAWVRQKEKFKKDMDNLVR